MTSPSDRRGPDDAAHSAAAPHSAAALDGAARRIAVALSDDARHTLAQELAAVTAWLSAVRSCDTPHVLPLTQLHDAFPPPREDRVLPSLSRDAALRNAPDTDGAWVRVPRVL